MKKRKFNSLSSRILSAMILTMLVIVAGIFLSLEQINKKAFYTAEVQKAKLILQTIEPMIAVDIYLGLETKILSILQQLAQNKDIVSFKIIKNGTVVYKAISKEKKTMLFVLKKDILHPNSQKKIGTIELTYSDGNYKELMYEYTRLLIVMLIVLILIFLLLSFYIRKLLKPLSGIAKVLKRISPEAKLKIEPIKQNNEIALMISALNKMQEKIYDFTQQQKNIKTYLEEEVNKKTIALQKQLYTDALTQLPNRKKLFTLLESAQSNKAVLILNIDDFKEINDFYGQVAGDYVLIEFAKRLKVFIEYKGDVFLSRLSADEFALLFNDMPSEKSFLNVVQELTDTVEDMLFVYEESEIYIRVTLGGTMESSEMLEKADIALKQAKEHKKQFLLYDQTLDIQRQYKENMEWVQKLKSAIKEDRIVPYFQAIFDSKTQEVRSYECLIRLVEKDATVVSPYKFLAIAQKSKLYPQLTKIMIEKSCHYFQDKEMRFSVNLSIEDILDADMVSFIKETIKKYKVNEQIVFEILETEGIENYKEAALFISQMKELGCKIAIDDFGSGYSNYEHILKLDIDYIKIDGSLIKNLDTDKNVAIVVETIVDFAKKLNLIVIAEFVHNQAVFEKVKALDIERVQGYYLAEPENKT